MGSDGGITLDRTRVFRAILTCTTCKSVVAVGPPVTGDEADAAYLLGVTEGAGSLVRHMGICAGGALALAFEQQPPPVPQPPLVPGPPPPRGRRAPYALTPARIIGRRPR